jgi:hypothetical protein
MPQIESKCRFCQALQEEVYYLFCDVKCREFYILGVEMNMKSEKINLPEELFKSWLEDETNKIENLSAEEITERIMTLEKLIFESKTRLSIAYQKKIKLMGSDWAANSVAISSPDFRVNYDKDQRVREPRIKQTKEEKAAKQTEAAGIDPVKLKELIKQKMLERAKKPMASPTTVKVVEKKEEVVPEKPVSKTAIVPSLIDDGDFD